MEFELADDDQPVLYKMGEAFFHLSLPAAKKQLRVDTRRYEVDIERLRGRAEECETGMKELKVLLYVLCTRCGRMISVDLIRYAKFGKQINLETTPE